MTTAIIDTFLNVRNTDPQASHTAAASLTGNTLCERVTRFLADHDRPEGWTQMELADAMGLDRGMGIWKRLSDVRRDGHAVWVTNAGGEILTRPGPNGRPQGASRIAR